MKYFQTWQDFMREPANKALKESKGIHACKQKYIQEQNKMQWYDPMILQEGQQDAGALNSANASDGGSTTYLTGKDAEVSTYTWDTTIGLTNNWTGSANFGVTAYSIQEGADFSYGHTNVRKKVLLAFVSGSNMKDFGGKLDTTGYHCVVTASLTALAGLLQTPSGSSGSAGDLMSDNIAGQGATAEVAGFENTIAPSTLVSVATSSAGGASFTVTNAFPGDVFASTTDSPSGSIATTTHGTMKFLNDSTDQTIPSLIDPYKANPFASDASKV